MSPHTKVSVEQWKGWTACGARDSREHSGKQVNHCTWRTLISQVQYSGFPFLHQHLLLLLCRQPSNVPHGPAVRAPGCERWECGPVGYTVWSPYMLGYCWLHWLDKGSLGLNLLRTSQDLFTMDSSGSIHGTLENTRSDTLQSTHHVCFCSVVKSCDSIYQAQYAGLSHVLGTREKGGL